MKILLPIDGSGVWGDTENNATGGEWPIRYLIRVFAILHLYLIKTVIPTEKSTMNYIPKTDVLSGIVGCQIRHRLAVFSKRHPGAFSYLAVVHSANVLISASSWEHA